MSYGVNFPNMFRRAAEYVDKILRGTRFGSRQVDNEIELGRLFDGDVGRLRVNLKTARTLGLTIPQSLLATADEVIE